MESHTGDDSKCSEGESEASLVELLQQISNCEDEAAFNDNSAISWSEEDLLCESGAETEAALKVAAQSVRQTQVPVEMNPQRQDKQKSKGDKSQNELT